MMKRAEKGQELEDLNQQMMHRLISQAISSRDRPRTRPMAAPHYACARRVAASAASVYRGAVPVRWIRREEKNGRWQEAATSTFSIG